MGLRDMYSAGDIIEYEGGGRDYLVSIEGEEVGDWTFPEEDGPRGVLEWLGFSVHEGEEGVDFIYFEDDGYGRYRDDMGRAVFDACAPVIGAGSVLVFMENWDEAEEKDPRIWRYTFDGEKMRVQDGRFVF